METMVRLAKLARIAYKEDNRIEEELNKIDKFMNFEILHFGTKDTGDLKCILIKDKDNLTIAIRGTANLKNWIDLNFDFDKVYLPFGEGMVHKGFLYATNLLLSALSCKINKTINITITGHSLGAAITKLLADRLHTLNYNIANCYTFGLPKVGNSEYRKWSESLIYPHFNVLNDIDAIYNAPPFFMGYSAFEVTDFITSSNMVIDSPSKLYLHFYRITHIFDKSSYIGGIEPVEDHSMNNYLLQLENFYLKNKK